MSTPDTQPAQQKYYDPAEVEAYVADVTKTIKTLQGRLQDAVRRAEQAEQSGHGERVEPGDQPSSDYHPDSASLARALLLAGEVADKTIADADTRATEIVQAAERRAAAIVEAAHTEGRRLVDTAGSAAADVFQKGEARLLAAVSAFVDGSNVLRNALARIEEDATSWRSSSRAPQLVGRPPSDSITFTPTPRLHQAVEPRADQAPPPAAAVVPKQPGGVHNGASRNGFRSSPPEVAPVDRSIQGPPPTGTPRLTFPPSAPGDPT